MGGLFDIDGDWRPNSADCAAIPRVKGHCSHRDGKDVDIGVPVHVVATNTEIRIDCTADRELQRIATQLNHSREYPFPVKLLCESRGRKHVDFD
jgi:hypothetical protein